MKNPRCRGEAKEGPHEAGTTSARVQKRYGGGKEGVKNVRGNKEIEWRVKSETAPVRSPELRGNGHVKRLRRSPKGSLIEREKTEKKGERGDLKLGENRRKVELGSIGRGGTEYKEGASMVKRVSLYQGVFDVAEKMKAPPAMICRSSSVQEEKSTERLAGAAALL